MQRQSLSSDNLNNQQIAEDILGMIKTSKALKQTELEFGAFEMSKPIYELQRKNIDNATSILDIKTAIQELLSQNLYPNILIFNYTIQGFGYAGLFNEAYHLYKIALKEIARPDRTHTFMIEAVGHARLIDVINQVFIDAKTAYEKKSISQESMTRAINSFIKLQTKLYISQAESAYEYAVKKNLISDVTCYEMIRLAGKAGRVDLVNQIYEKGISLGVTDVRFFNNTIKAAGSLHLINIVEDAYKRSTPNKHTFQFVITAAGLNKRLDLAKGAYELAIAQDPSYEKSYVEMIHIAGTLQDIELAKEIWETSKRNRPYNNIVTLALIKVLGKANQIDQALKLYQEILATNNYSKELFLAMIIAAGSSKSAHIAMDVYQTFLKSTNRQDTLDILIDIEAIQAGRETHCLDLIQLAYKQMRPWYPELIRKLLHALIKACEVLNEKDLAMRVFDDLMRSELIHNNSFTHMLKAYQKNNWPETIEIKYCHAFQNKQITPELETAMIDQLCSTNQVAKARQLYDIAHSYQTSPIVKTKIKLRKEWKKIFKELSFLRSYYLCGSSVISVLDKHPSSKNDLDFVSNYKPDQQLYDCGFRPSRYIPNLFVNNNIDLMLMSHTNLRTDDDLKLLKKQRDFTICSILLDKYGNVYDLTGHGLDDINKKTLRANSHPKIIFAEDPTRLLRAIKYILKGYKPSSDIVVALKAWQNNSAVNFNQIIINVKKDLEKIDKNAYVRALIKYGLYENLFGLTPCEDFSDSVDQFINHVSKAWNVIQSPKKYHHKQKTQLKLYQHNLTLLKELYHIDAHKNLNPRYVDAQIYQQFKQNNILDHLDINPKYAYYETQPFLNSLTHHNTIAELPTPPKADCPPEEKTPVSLLPDPVPETVKLKKQKKKTPSSPKIKTIMQKEWNVSQQKITVPKPLVENKSANPEPVKSSQEIKKILEEKRKTKNTLCRPFTFFAVTAIAVTVGAVSFVSQQLTLNK